jgi:hypothetical protein
MDQIPPWLCEECASIDFRKIFSPPLQISNSNGVCVAELGTRLETADERDCALCWLFYSVRVYRELEPPDSKYHLRAYPRLRNNYDIRFSRVPRSLREQDSIYLAAVPGKNDPVVSPYKIHDSCLVHGYIARVADHEASSTSFHGRVVPGLVDFSVCREWLEFCKRHHSRSCGRQDRGIQSPNNCAEKQDSVKLKLIDCSGNSDNNFPLVLKGSSEPYIALGYVWGTPEKNRRRSKHSIFDAGHLLMQDLPKVVLDAIQATKNLGYQFLWVDKYCINQDDNKEKDMLLGLMDIIYAQSEITIVAAAGEDSDHGLVGVSNVQREFQYQAKTSAGTLVAFPYHPHGSIRTSKWASRGWTYQEGVLARRRLIFTSEQMYFECESMNCYESVYSPLQVLHKNDKSSFRHFVRSGLFTGTDYSTAFHAFNSNQHSIQPTITEILIHTENFTSRKLSYSSDSLNAFRGIIRKFENSSLGMISFIWGLPFRLESKELALATFAVSITWRHVNKGSEVPQRRRTFPSWSWVGWEGIVEFGPKYATQVSKFVVSTENNPIFSFTHDNLAIRVITKEDASCPLDIEQWRCLSQPPGEFSQSSSFDILHLTAWTLDAQYFAVRKTSKEELTVGGRKAWLSWSKPPASQEVFIRGLEAGEFVCLVIGYSYDQAYYLILENLGEDYERIGSMVVRFFGDQEKERWKGIRQSFRIR